MLTPLRPAKTQAERRSSHCDKAAPGQARGTARVRTLDARDREEERKKRIREQADHANHCAWGEEFGRWPLFEIDKRGNVFCTYDGKHVIDSRQTLAEHFYWMEVGWGPSGGLIHDEEAQAFYTPEGDLALSREYVNISRLFNADDA